MATLVCPRQPLPARAARGETHMSYYQQHQSDFLEGLKAFLRIPSISTLSEHKPDIRRAAEFARTNCAPPG